MKYVFLIIVSLFFTFEDATAKSKSYGNIQDAVYIKNYDGDTVTFKLRGLHPIIGENISIRVKDIDTPEIRGKCPQEKVLAKKAKKFVKDVMERTWYTELHNISRGKYFRIVADIIVDGNNLSDLLIQEKFAVRYTGGTKTFNWCDKTGDQ